MLMRPRPFAALILTSLFVMQAGACSSQETGVEESIQPASEDAPAEITTEAEKSEADIEREKALGEASSSDFTDPNEVQLHGDAALSTPVDPVDNTVDPEASAMADTPVTIEDPAVSELTSESSFGIPSAAAIYFASSSARVSREYREQLKEVAAKLKADRSMKVTLTGHSDNRGRAAFNRRLAMKRARAVKAALMKMGVKGKQMTVGTPQLAQSGETAEEHAQNRRVEIEFQ